MLWAYRACRVADCGRPAVAVCEPEVVGRSDVDSGDVWQSPAERVGRFSWTWQSSKCLSLYARRLHGRRLRAVDAAGCGRREAALPTRRVPRARSLPRLLLLPRVPHRSTPLYAPLRHPLWSALWLRTAQHRQRSVRHSTVGGRSSSTHQATSSACGHVVDVVVQRSRHTHA